MDQLGGAIPSSLSIFLWNNLSTSSWWKLYGSKKALWAFWWPFGQVWGEGEVLQIWLDPCFHFVVFTLLIQFVSLQMTHLTKLYSVCMYFETPKYWNVPRNPAPQIDLSVWDTIQRRTHTPIVHTPRSQLDQERSRSDHNRPELLKNLGNNWRGPFKTLLHATE